MVAAPALTRREALLGALCAGCSPLLMGRSKAGEPAYNTQTPKEIAPGIFVRRGVDEDATASNDDAIANIGFVVGNDAVAVIDPGGSFRDGERLREYIGTVTKRPIRYVVMTHGHPDHIFGAGAFQQDQPQFIGHSLLPRTLASRGQYYRRRLNEILGAGQAGPIVTPTQLVQGHSQIDLGGRLVQLTSHGTAHSECDLTALDSLTATLFAGDLLFVERVPALDGSLRGWLSELNLLKRLGVQRAVPGHGPTSVQWPQGAQDLERYLLILQRETRQAIAKGVEISAAVNTVAESERGRWKLFDSYNGHNITQAFKELEWE